MCVWWCVVVVKCVMNGMVEIDVDDVCYGCFECGGC